MLWRPRRNSVLRRGCSRPSDARLLIEELEHRQMLATLMANSSIDELDEGMDDDAVSFSGAISMAMVGDTNWDGEVNLMDFVNLSNNFPNGVGWHQGNFDGSENGTQFNDFVALSVNFGQSSTMSATSSGNTSTSRGFVVDVDGVSKSFMDVVPTDDEFVLSRNETLVVAAQFGVLVNDSGLAVATVVSPPQRGELTLAEDGSFSYTPHSDFHTGIDTFTYRSTSGSFLREATVSLVLPSDQHQRELVINELHVDPDVDTELVEFIEIHNTSDVPVSLVGMYFSAGIRFVFGNDTWIAPHGFFTITQNLEAFQQKFGFDADGQWTGRLSNEGETVALRSAMGDLIDQVAYGQGFPWPTVGDAPGYSMELIHPNLDNQLGGSWRASIGRQSILKTGDSWRYFKGTEEPSIEPSAWTQPGFDDEAWETGLAPIGRSGRYPISTRLDDFRRNYSTVYLRTAFHVDDPSSIETLTLSAFFDDGLNVWINGTHIAGSNVASAELPFDAVAETTNDAGFTVDVVVSDPANLLVAGENVIAAQLLNRSLASGDIYFDAMLWNPSLRVPGPTPNALNSIFAQSSGPHLQEVLHVPQQPTSDQNVTVTAVATDPDGVTAVTLEYQINSPGDYIRKTDVDFETRWTALPMRDDGTLGDAQAADSVYTAVIPASLHQHRHLVRYRIRARDTQAAAVAVPYADDPQLNFAYFIYDGVPDWTGADQPGVSEPVTFGSDIMNQLPTYHLIANAEDVENSQFDSRFEEVRFPGTMIYDGQVYDHISFRVRGEFSTYVTGKNKWKFFFNRGHEFQARDDYGRPYNQPWRVMNFSGGTTPWVSINRGMAGIGEAIGYQLNDLAGSPSPNNNFVHFRVIDEADEATASQYDGDLWGLYLTVENPDRRFLDARQLPPGTTYKMEGHGDIKNQEQIQPDAATDIREFNEAASSETTPEAWWRENVDLATYFTFRAISRAMGNVDVRPGWQHYLYHNSETDKWTIIPWDLDALFVIIAPHLTSPDMSFEPALQFDALQTEYKNRARELQDLLFNEDQVGKLVDEYAGFVNPPTGGLTMVDLDQFMWNHNPRTEETRRGSFNQRFTETRILESGDHEGLAQWIRDYMTPGPGGGSSPAAFGWNVLQEEAHDEAIPHKPVVTYVGGDFGIDDLAFRTSRFSDPQGDDTFGALQWRLAKVTDRTTPSFDPNLPPKYEIESVWESEVETTFQDLITVPAGKVEPGHAYRIRVRVQDDSGRWSHWSLPVEFIATSARSLAALENIRVSEIHYHPADPTDAERQAGHVDADAFEFVELINVGDVSLDVSAVQLVQANFGGDVEGVSFDFGSSTVTYLAPGERVVIVEDLEAFHFRYGPARRVAGQWKGRLSNAAEQLSVAVFGNLIQQFRYDDQWYADTDGAGASLQMINPASADLGLWKQSSGWRSSALTGGTPGRDELPTTRGDFDGNDQIDAADIDLLIAQVRAGSNSPAFDLTDDLVVDQADADDLIHNRLATDYGDTNLDGDIDFSDFVTLSRHFGIRASWTGGDINGNGIVDTEDFARLSANFGKNLRY